MKYITQLQLMPSPPCIWAMVCSSPRDSMRDGRGGADYSINAKNLCVGVDINDLSMSPLMYANL